MANKSETLLMVEGMTCSSCVRHVTSALRGVDGVDEVVVEIEDGKVRVQHGPAATIDAMLAALGDAGYESRPAEG